MYDLLEIVARAGGGGSSSGGGAGGLIALPFIIIAAIVGFIRRKKRIKKAKADIAAAVATDAAWSEDALTNHVKDTFYKFQQDWSTFNTQSMQAYLSPSFAQHMYLVLLAMHQLGRKNLLTEIELKPPTIMGISDNADDSQDTFVAEITARAVDSLVTDVDEQFLKTSGGFFSEQWNFKRSGDTWLLDSIDQAADILSANYSKPKNAKYMDFAQANGYFYNADFGWLLLPTHGALFGKASFNTSDINHHVIGQHQDRVVQFFEYIPIIPDKVTLITSTKRLFSRNKRSRTSKYTVAQITLPKVYGGIVVEQKSVLSSMGLSVGPKGMNKMNFSPVAFGKKFDVYASDLEQATSFELLHPAYLEKLINLEFKVDIEVVGDNLYLYSSDKDADYNQMLELLKAAYKELWM